MSQISSTSIPTRFSNLPGLLPTRIKKPTISGDDSLLKTGETTRISPSKKVISVVPLTNSTNIESKRLSPNPPTPKKINNLDVITMATTEQKNPMVNDNVVKIKLPNPFVEIKNEDKSYGEYQGIITNSSLERELVNNGYNPISRIMVKGDERKTKYIKANNKKGQIVFILIDTNGYTSSKDNDITLMDTNNATVIPYSSKMGAYSCAGKDVCGIAFECGSDSICILSHGDIDPTPIESNYVFVETKMDTGKVSNTVMPYPIIKLSEIRANPNLILKNTDLVTRRLRNSNYNAELNAFNALQQSLQKLNNSVNKFSMITQNAAAGLTRTLAQLDEWNDIYLENPPVNDEAKEKYRRLQYNLSHRNQGVSNLLRIMNKVSDKSKILELIGKEINELADLCEKEFANVEFAVYE